MRDDRAVALVAAAEALEPQGLTSIRARQRPMRNGLLGRNLPSMGVIQAQRPEQLQPVAEGRVASRSEFLVEATRRLAEEIAFEDEIVATLEDATALHEPTITCLRSRLAADQGECSPDWSAMPRTGSTPPCSTAPGAEAPLLPGLIA